MNERISTLRKNSLDATNTMSAERALLVTDFYETLDPSLPVPVQRALAFRYIMENKSLCIQPGELIVGERGPQPKAAPTFPEICLHSLEDLDVINSRPKVSFRVDKQTRDTYRDRIIPFWKGRSMRDHVFATMSDDWKKAYSAGVFTEFQEQRAPGHTVAGSKLFGKGIKDLLADIRGARQNVETCNDPAKRQKLDQLLAMEIVAQAAIGFARRHVNKLEEFLKGEKNESRRDELLDIISVCRRVPENAPETFHEALQHYWFIHVGVITELNPWDSFNPGRLDQHLYPFYKADIERGHLTPQRAKELLQAFWIKFNNHPSPPKMGVTALESNTYTDFALINLGGLNSEGGDAVNELTFILLDVIEEMRLLQPSSMVLVSKRSPERFVKRAIEIIRTGFGQPSFFNADTIVMQLLRQGKSLTDARAGGASGCVETGAFGTEAYTLSGYFNLNKVLELTLQGGLDPLTGIQTGLNTGEPDSFNSFDEFYEAFEKQLRYFIDIKIDGNRKIEKLYAEMMPSPFLSLFIDDCIANATDYNGGGARYNTSYIQGVGLGSITDNLASIEQWVYHKKELSLSTLVNILGRNFNTHESWRFRFIYETPKWGNNNHEADIHAARVFNSFFNAVDGRPSFRNGVFRINMLPTTSHVYFGSKLGAMPDGRLAHEPLSEGISPVQGADTNGPVAVLLSASKIDHIKTGGTLLNQKFSPAFFRNEESVNKLASLVRTYFRLDGHHIQFNVVDADTLRDAQKNPEKYRDLIVRVAGYSDYFNDLGAALQDEIIRRTEHETL